VLREGLYDYRHTTIVARMSGEAIRLVGAREIRERLGNLSRQRVYQITSDDSFPKPVAVLKQGKIWAEEDFEAWIAEHRSAFMAPAD
jgi:prophage regulatory protein